jgi:hypothetical protein
MQRFHLFIVLTCILSANALLVPLSSVSFALPLKTSKDKFNSATQFKKIEIGALPLRSRSNIQMSATESVSTSAIKAVGKLLVTCGVGL